MKRIIFVQLFVIFFASSVFAERHYERVFTGSSGSGYVTVDVTDKIYFKITVTSGEAWFCGDPESIVQEGKQYDIRGYCSDNDCIRIIWQNFSGCGDIYEGVTATGIMSFFPTFFDVWDSFRIYCGIWEYDDYFDIEAGTEPTTTTTTISSHPTTSSTSSTVITTTIPTTTTTTGICASETIYGEQSAETKLLRSLRDNILSKTIEGQELIKLYYQWSPAIVKAMEDDEGFKEEVKEMVDVILPFIRGGIK